jgi:rhomboid protease GluP
LLIKWAIYALIFGFLIGANNAAHVGGMLGGLALGFTPEGTRHTPHWGYFWNGAAWVSAGLWAVTSVFLVHSILVNWTPGGVPPL